MTRPEVDAERIGALAFGWRSDDGDAGRGGQAGEGDRAACYRRRWMRFVRLPGPQDAEQSIPGFIAAGFDFADWVELAAPRPYAIVGTVSDMFPWAGLLATAKEARRFYGLFDARALGAPGPTSQNRDVGDLMETPTGPALNSDTANAIAADGTACTVIAGDWRAWEFEAVDVPDCEFLSR